MNAIQTLLHWLPLWFGLGFIAPLIAQSMERLGWHAPLGLSPLLFGLIVGAALGTIATLRGRWL